METYFEKIEAYYLGLLDEKEKEAFESELSASAELRQELKIYKHSRQAINQIIANDLKKELDGWWEEEHGGKKKMTVFRKLLSNKAAIAASVAILLSVFAWLIYRNLDPSISPEQFALNQFSDIVVDTQKSIDTSVINPLDPGVRAYLSEDYIRAEQLFNSIRTESPFFQKSQLYLAYIFLMKKDWVAAAEKFNSLALLPNAAYKDESEWYHLLSIVMGGGSQIEIQSLLKNITSNKTHQFYQEALQLNEILG